ncbi:MAG: hypothetical protein J5I90_22025 [Caldilineales bacterium]|nr:hypothetical protein [Caldilineales bacterium]
MKNQRQELKQVITQLEKAYRDLARVARKNEENAIGWLHMLKTMLDYTQECALLIKSGQRGKVAKVLQNNVPTISNTSFMRGEEERISRVPMSYFGQIFQYSLDEENGNYTEEVLRSEEDLMTEMVGALEAAYVIPAGTIWERLEILDPLSAQVVVMWRIPFYGSPPDQPSDCDCL